MSGDQNEVPGDLAGALLDDGHDEYHGSCPLRYGAILPPTRRTRSRSGHHVGVECLIYHHVALGKTSTGTHLPSQCLQNGLGNVQAVHDYEL